MPSLKDMRRWLRGERVTGLPKHKSEQPKPKQQVGDAVSHDEEDGGEQGSLDVRKMKAKRTSTKWAKGAKWRLISGGTDATLMFGKYKGSRVSELAAPGGGRHGGRDYLEWMMTQDFPKELLDVIDAHINPAF